MAGLYGYGDYGVTMRGCMQSCVRIFYLMADGRWMEMIARRRKGGEGGEGSWTHGHISLITHPHDATSLDLIENIV